MNVIEKHLILNLKRGNKNKIINYYDNLVPISCYIKKISLFDFYFLIYKFNLNNYF